MLGASSAFSSSFPGQTRVRRGGVNVALADARQTHDNMPDERALKPLEEAFINNGEGGIGLCVVTLNT